MVLEDVLEINDVLVVECAVNLDFGEQLLLRSLLLQRTLINDLRGHNSAGLGICDFEALREATLPKKPPLGVPT